MSKKRLIYWIFSLLGSVALLTLCIYSDHVFLYSLGIFGLLFINFTFRRNDINILNNIMLRYSTNCDSYQYLEELQQYASRCILNKAQKCTFKLYYALAYIDGGDFDKAKDLLLELDDKQKYLNSVTTILYLKAWCDYFYFQDLNEKMKYTLLKIKNLIMEIKSYRTKAGFMMIYNILEAKYSLLIEENLDQAEEIFRARLSGYPTTLAAISVKYSLGMIDIKRKQYEQGVEKLRLVAKMDKNLYLCKRANEIVNQYDNLKRGILN